MIDGCAKGDGGALGLAGSVGGGGCITPGESGGSANVTRCPRSADLRTTAASASDEAGENGGGGSISYG